MKRQTTIRRRWEAIEILSIAGLVTGSLVGASLAVAGRTATSGNEEVSAAVAAIICFGLAANVLGILSVRVPQARRQTNGWCRKALTARQAAILWGLDLGLTFSTWLTFAGAWALAGVVFAQGDVLVGAAVFSAYWMGRVLSVGLAPLVLDGTRQLTDLLDGIEERRVLIGRVHAITLIAIGLMVLPIAAIHNLTAQL